MSLAWEPCMCGAEDCPRCFPERVIHVQQELDDEEDEEREFYPGNPHDYGSST